MDYEIIRNSNSNDWIMFIHGFGGSPKTWKPQILVFAKEYNIIALDMHGISSGSLTGTGKLSPVEITYMIKKILDAEGISKLNIVTMSSGALTGLLLCVMYPELSKSLVLSGGMLRFDGLTSFLLKTVNVLLNIMPYRWLHFIMAYIMLPNKNHSLSRKHFVASAKIMGRSEFAGWIKIVNKYKSILENGFADIKNDITDFHLKIEKIPNALFIMGDSDHVFLKSVIKNHKIIKTSILKIVNKCGHVVNLEKYDEFNDIVLHFLKART